MTGHMIVRALLVAAGIASIVIAAGFAFQTSAITRLWPWPDSPLSYLLIASIVGPIGLACLHVAWSGHLRAAVAGGLALVFGAGGMAAVLVALGGYGGYVLGYGLVAAAGASLIAIGSKADGNEQAAPKPARLAILAITLVLIAVGIALSVQMRHVFPWPLKPETSLLYGCMFLGLVVSYAYAAIRGHWSDVQLLLIGVLAYDLVLIGPFLKHFGNVLPDHRTSLILYTAVLASTGTVAAYYLVLRGGWRIGPFEARAQTIRHV